MDVRIRVHSWKYSHMVWSLVALCVSVITQDLHFYMLSTIAGLIFFVSYTANIFEMLWLTKELVLSDDGIQIGKQFFPKDTIQRISINPESTVFQIRFKNKWRDAPVVMLNKKDYFSSQQIRQWAWRNGIEVRNPFDRGNR